MRSCFLTWGSCINFHKTYYCSCSFDEYEVWFLLRAKRRPALVLCILCLSWIKINFNFASSCWWFNAMWYLLSLQKFNVYIGQYTWDSHLSQFSWLIFLIYFRYQLRNYWLHHSTNIHRIDILLSNINFIIAKIKLYFIVNEFVNTLLLMNVLTIFHQPFSFFCLWYRRR